METIITFVAGIVVSIVGFFFFSRHSGGTEGVKRSIQRAGEHINRARGRVADNNNRISGIETEIKESRESVGRVEENEQRNIKRAGTIRGLVKRGRKAIESIERKTDSPED